MSNQKYYYKVVTEDLKSVVVNEDEKYCVQYKINKWVETKHEDKGLLVFDDITRATSYMHINFTFRIFVKLFRCTCKNKLPLHHRYWIDGGYLSNGIRLHWPEGTLSFKKVKLLEEIKIE